MRTTLLTVALALIGAVLVPLSAPAQGYGISGGIHYDVPSGDLDDGYGVYLSYLYDLTDFLGISLGAGYTTGDYDLSEAVGLSGSYSTTALEASTVAAIWEPSEPPTERMRALKPVASPVWCGGTASMIRFGIAA